MTGLKLARIRVAGCEQRFHREFVVAGTAPWPAGRAVQRGGWWTHTACPLPPTGATHACLHCIWTDGGTSALANQPGGAQRGSLPGPRSQQVETTSLESGSQPPDSEAIPQSRATWVHLGELSLREGESLVTAHVRLADRLLPWRRSPAGPPHPSPVPSPCWTVSGCFCPMTATTA